MTGLERIMCQGARNRASGAAGWEEAVGEEAGCNMHRGVHGSWDDSSSSISLANTWAVSTLTTSRCS